VQFHNFPRQGVSQALLVCGTCVGTEWRERAVCVEVLYDEELKTLQSAFDQVCANLGVDEHDEGRRARLAMLMLSLAEGGEPDLEVIMKRAAFQMQHPN
jgi:hypothetical protein